ncbi:MAG: hypothetical protein ACTSUQ_12210 [Candidatus Freyarchaeota archaeon]
MYSVIIGGITLTICPDYNSSIVCPLIPGRYDTTPRASISISNGSNPNSPITAAIIPSVLIEISLPPNPHKLVMNGFRELDIITKLPVPLHQLPKHLTTSTKRTSEMPKIPLTIL